jgi:hypothetical protein
MIKTLAFSKNHVLKTSFGNKYIFHSKNKKFRGNKDLFHLETQDQRINQLIRLVK